MTTTDKSYSSRLALRLALAALAVGLSSCESGSSTPAAGAAFLQVSVSEFYFGTRNVGTTAIQKIELANQSGDVYPINRLTLKGLNADEFNTNFSGGITLNPSQKIAIDVSFSPLSDGLKNAVLDIDYEIIKQVSEEDNLNEKTFYAALKSEEAGDYASSQSQYEQYLSNKPVTVNKKRAEIKLPVLSESDRHGTGEEFNYYLQALNSRDDGNTAASLDSLDALLANDPDSYLADDAVYLQGYIQLMDHDDPERAVVTMAKLRKQYPDSTYFDTALYSEALAHEELGDLPAARSHLEELIERHRSETWAKLNLNMPKDNFLSRMWFERASARLALLD